jgi:hypothetical protein
MMLRTVKNLVLSKPEMPFGQFYLNYVMRVQDANIDKSMKSLLKYNRYGVDKLATAIEDVYLSIDINKLINTINYI